MKPILHTLIILLLVLTISCAYTPSAKESMAEENVSFMKSSHHFVSNKYEGETNPSYLIIRNYHTFASLFGIAAVMGMSDSNLITEEKMKNRFVLSIIQHGRDFRKLNIEKITLQNKQLKVYYTSEVTMPDTTAYFNCHVTVLVDNCNFESVLIFENGRPKPDAIIKEL